MFGGDDHSIYLGRKSQISLSLLRASKRFNRLQRLLGQVIVSWLLDTKGSESVLDMKKGGRNKVMVSYSLIRNAHIDTPRTALTES